MSIFLRLNISPVSLNRKSDKLSLDTYRRISKKYFYLPAEIE